MSTHTPGPWQVVEGKNVFTKLGGARADGLCADGNDGWQVADCGMALCFVDGEEHTLPFAEEAANARLIAAAPELLKELSLLASLVGPWVEAGNKIPGIATLNGAWAAIAKATQP